MSQPISFETYLNKAAAAEQSLSEPALPLEQALKAYDEGTRALQEARAILENAKGQILQVADKETSTNGSSDPSPKQPKSRAKK